MSIFILFPVILFQIEDDFLYRFVDQISSSIRLLKCQFLSWRLLPGRHAQRLPSLLRHVEAWLSRVRLDLRNANELSVVFELSDHIEPASRIGICRREHAYLVGLLYSIKSL